MSEQDATFGACVITTEHFLQSLKRLMPASQRLVCRKIELLARNARHPSLQAHRLHRAAGLWVAYVNMSLRLLYDHEDGKLRILEVGSHVVVERAHQRN